MPETIRRTVDEAVRLLDAHFKGPGLRSHPVEGAAGIFEAYVDATYRITFERHGDVFVLRNVDNHDECLRNPWCGLVALRSAEVSKHPAQPECTYWVALKPGTYVADLTCTEGIAGSEDLPRTVEIKSGKTARADLSIDAGLRKGYALPTPGESGYLGCVALPMH